jgi:ribosome maturation factor RimP
MEEELKKLIGKKVKVVCLYPDSQIIFYTGIIQEVRDNTLVLIDKFNNTVLINLDIIKEVSTVNNFSNNLNNKLNNKNKNGEKGEC